MPEPTLSGGGPQFSTAEYATSGSDRCKSCNTGISGQYYRVNGALACPHCAEQVKRGLPVDSHQIFVRGVAFGVGGAILGLIVYAGFGILTGLMIGYVSLAVGYIVGKAMMKGSNGVGGRRYQVAAALLTYAAVSLAAVPIGISQYVKLHKDTAVRPATSNGSSQKDPAVDAIVVTPDGTAPKPKPSFGAALGALAIAGLASPFLELQDPIHGVIGLIILSVGIRIAWKLTQGRRVDILGPFDKAATSTP